MNRSLKVSSVAHALLVQKGECWTWNQRFGEAWTLSPLGVICKENLEYSVNLTQFNLYLKSKHEETPFEIDMEKKQSNNWFWFYASNPKELRYLNVYHHHPLLKETDYLL